MCLSSSPCALCVLAVLCWSISALDQTFHFQSFARCVSGRGVSVGLWSTAACGQALLFSSFGYRRFVTLAWCDSHECELAGISCWECRTPLFCGNTQMGDGGQEALLWIICALQAQNHPGLPCPAWCEIWNMFTSYIPSPWGVGKSLCAAWSQQRAREQDWRLGARERISWCTWGGEVMDESGCALWLLIPDLPSSAPRAVLHSVGSWMLDGLQRCLTGLPMAL